MYQFPWTLPLHGGRDHAETRGPPWSSAEPGARQTGQPFRVLLDSPPLADTSSSPPPVLMPPSHAVGAEVSAHPPH